MVHLWHPNFIRTKIIPLRGLSGVLLLSGSVAVHDILTMHFLISTLILGAACNGIQADATQIPLQLEYCSYISWNFSEKPSHDSTSHLIFDTVNSLLQRWTNTRYRNGQIIVVSFSSYNLTAFGLRTQYRTWNDSHRHSSLSCYHQRRNS